VRPLSENFKLSQGSEGRARYLVMRGPSDDAECRPYSGAIGAAAHGEESRPRHGTRRRELRPREAVMQSADVALNGKDGPGDIDFAGRSVSRLFATGAVGAGGGAREPPRGRGVSLAPTMDGGEGAGQSSFFPTVPPLLQTRALQRVAQTAHGLPWL
jgi:hypothetical protein